MQLKTSALEILVFASLFVPAQKLLGGKSPASPTIPQQIATAEYDLLCYDLHTHYMPYPKLHLGEMLNALVILLILCFKNSVSEYLDVWVRPSVCKRICAFTHHIPEWITCKG